jgi:hypothetical protein
MNSHLTRRTGNCRVADGFFGHKRPLQMTNPNVALLWE